MIFSRVEPRKFMGIIILGWGGELVSEEAYLLLHNVLFMILTVNHNLLIPSDGDIGRVLSQFRRPYHISYIHRVPRGWHVPWMRKLALNHLLSLALFGGGTGRSTEIFSR